MRQFVPTLLALSGLLLGSPSAWAKFYQLFSAPGVQVEDYNEIVAGLKPGDEVGFSNGSRFAIGRVLGQGNTSKILAAPNLRDGIRIPLKSGMFDKTRSYVEFIDRYLNGYKRLVEYGVPVLQVFPEESLSKEFVKVEVLRIQFRYTQWIAGHLNLNSEWVVKVREDFVEFAKRTWRFLEIGDMGTDQIAYVRGRGWLFIDFDDTHKVAEKVTDGTIFNKSSDEIFLEQVFAREKERMFASGFDKIPMPNGLHVRVMGVIEAERLKQGLPPPRFSCVRWLTEKWNVLFRRKKE